MRTPNPIAQLTAPERVYALDAVNDLMVCPLSLVGPGLADVVLGIRHGG